MTDELKTPTPASEIRKMREKGVVLTLHTGRQIQMRGVDPSHFMKELDAAPLAFQTLIVDMFWKGDYGAKVEAFIKPRETAADTADFVTALGIVAQKALLRPRIVETPQTDEEEEEIALSDLGGDELASIFRLAFLPHLTLYYLEANGFGAQASESAEDAPAAQAGGTSAE